MPVNRMFPVFLLAIFAVLSVKSHAIPLKWTVDAVGGTPTAKITGSFVFDEDTNTYSQIAIITQGVNGYNGLFDQFAYPFSVDVPPLGGLFRGFTAVPSVFGQGQDSPIVLLIFGPPTISNAGGTVTIASNFSSGVGTCVSLDTCSVIGRTETISSGSATASAIPLPGAFALLGSAVAALAFARRPRGRR